MVKLRTQEWIAVKFVTIINEFVNGVAQLDFVARKRMVIMTLQMVVMEPSVAKPGRNVF